MFKTERKNKALANLDSAVRIYQSQVCTIESSAEKLLQVREECSSKVIAEVEVFINTLANTPKSFSQAIEEFKVASENFDEVDHNAATAHLAHATAAVVGFNALGVFLGPLGLAIGAVTTVFNIRSKNQEAADKADAQSQKVREATSKIRTMNEKVQVCIRLTEQHSKGCLKICRGLQLHAPKDYTEFSEAQKHQTAALINHVNSLSEMMREKIE